jgi:hypothetical protein
VTQDKIILDSVMEASKNAAGNARSKIHQMKKGEEDKNLQDKSEEAAPHTSENAGRKIGQSLVISTDRAQDMAKGMAKDAQKSS